MLSRIAGKYHMEMSKSAVLGEGAYATVYQGVCTQSGRSVAIKSILLRTKNGKKVFDRELRVFSTLRQARAFPHAHLVEFLDSHVDHKIAALVLEHLREGTLEEDIALRGPLDPAEALHVFGVLVDTVGFLHRHGIAVLDIKAENIAFRRQPLFMKIFDFGLAYVHPRRNTPAALLPQAVTHDYSADYIRIIIEHGTPIFSPIEILSGLHASPYKVDIWALGHVYYFMTHAENYFDYIADSRIHLKSKYDILRAAVVELTNGAQSKIDAALFPVQKTVYAEGGRLERAGDSDNYLFDDSPAETSNLTTASDSPCHYFHSDSGAVFKACWAGEDDRATCSDLMALIRSF